MISTDRHGINLVPLSQSRASFDFSGDGQVSHTGWIGANTGFLVIDANGNGVIDNGTEMLSSASTPAASNGFAALATLDSNDDGIIDASDPAFSHLEVWVDSNGDGVTDPGELVTLHDLGIVSLDLVSTPVTVRSEGDTVVAIGSLTFSDGTTEAVDDVNFASTPPLSMSLDGQNPAALSILRDVVDGTIAEAGGGAAAVAANITDALNTLEIANDKLLSAITSAAKPPFEGHPLSAAQINIITADSSVVVVGGPAAARGTEQAVGQALSATQVAAQQIIASTSAQELTDQAAVIANSTNADIGSAADVTASQEAGISAASWQSVFSAMNAAAALLQTASTSLAASQAVVEEAALAPQEKYATTGDAEQAADSFAEQTASANALSLGNVSFQTLLSVIAQAWSATSTVFALDGTTLYATGGNLIIASGAAETLNDASTPSTYAIMEGAQVTISDFRAGSGGSRLVFLDPSHTATVSSVSAGTQVVVGSSTVLLVDVPASSLSISDNISGVETVDLAGIGSTPELSPSTSLADTGGLEVRNLSGVMAANAAAAAGQSLVVDVTDTAENVSASLDALQVLADDGQLASISLIDANKPSLSLTYQQLIVDAFAIGKVVSPYNLTVASVPVVNASKVASEADVKSVAISDSTENVSAGLDTLQALATDNKLASISLTNGGAPTLSLTAAQASNDATALNEIISPHSLEVTGVLATEASKVVEEYGVTSVAVTDTATNVSANLDALQTLAEDGQLSSVSLTDGGTPLLSLTSTMVIADATALSKISAPYGIAVTDTAENVATNLDALQMVAADGRLTSVALTDDDMPILPITSRQLDDDGGAISKIVSNYSLGVTNVAVLDTTSGDIVPAAAQVYNGPVGELQNEFLDLSPDNLNISVNTDGWFIHSGSGEDAIAAWGGTNVLDGGTGSNFLVGGSGTNTFFVDDRGATADIWSTISNFHAGDAATIWGVTPSSVVLAWADSQGAAGYSGLTAHFTAAGEPTASLTLSGYTTADLNNGRLSTVYGFDPESGSGYMYIHANN